MNYDLEFTLRPSWNSYINQLSIVVGTFFMAGYSEYLMPDEMVSDYVPKILFGIGLFFILDVLIRRYSSTFKLQDGRLMSQSGLIARNEVSIRLRDVRSIYLSQSLSDRLMNSGTLSFSSAAETTDLVIFKNIDKPKELREHIEMLIEQERQ